jgi:hypothetical protein
VKYLAKRDATISKLWMAFSSLSFINFNHTAIRSPTSVIICNVIKSNYIRDILDLLLDGDTDGKAFRWQIALLIDISYHYTGSGVFVSFSLEAVDPKYQFPEIDLVLNGIQISSTSENIEAEAQIFIKNGHIDYLEIWSKNGVYPKRELNSYILTQAWRNSPGRNIVNPS